MRLLPHGLVLQSAPSVLQSCHAAYRQWQGGNVRQVYKLKKGLTQELAKKIVADIKASKLKVQASIQGEQVRVSGKDKDELQEVIKMLRGNEDKYDYPLQFGNYR